MPKCLKGNTFLVYLFSRLNKIAKFLGVDKVSCGVEHLTKGLRWYVGNGQFIFCKEVSWFLLFFLKKPRVKLGHDMSISRVSQMFSSITHSWNLSTLNAIFEQDDIKHILVIPLSPFEREGCIIWHFERSGLYSVRSIYRIVRSMKLHNNGHS